MIRLKKLKSVRRRQSSLREQLWLLQGRVVEEAMSAQDPSDDTQEPSAEIPPTTEPVS